MTAIGHASMWIGAFSVVGLCMAAQGTAPWAVAVLPSGAEFTLEVAADDASRARGYMGRETIGPREGMLFVFGRSDRHPFWMKNCRARLDIVWLDEAYRVVEVAHDRPPCPEVGECPSQSPMMPARYVLEFAGGTARTHGLKSGDRIIVLSSGARGAGSP